MRLRALRAVPAVAFFVAGAHAEQEADALPARCVEACRDTAETVTQCAVADTTHDAATFAACVCAARQIETQSLACAACLKAQDPLGLSTGDTIALLNRCGWANSELRRRDRALLQGREDREESQPAAPANTAPLPTYKWPGPKQTTTTPEGQNTEAPASPESDVPDANAIWTHPLPAGDHDDEDGPDNKGPEDAAPVDDGHGPGPDPDRHEPSPTPTCTTNSTMPKMTSPAIVPGSGASVVTVGLASFVVAALTMALLAHVS